MLTQNEINVVLLFVLAGRLGEARDYANAREQAHEKEEVESK